MSKESRARYEKLKNSQSLKFGDFDVTKDWRFTSNPLRGYGGADTLVFNPNDPSQKFFLGRGEDEDIQEFLNLDGQKGEITRDDFQKYGLAELDPTGRYESVFRGSTLSQMAESKRLQELSEKINSGQITSEEGNRLANDPSQAASGVPPRIEGDVNDTEPASGRGAFERLSPEEAFRQRNPGKQTLGEREASRAPPQAQQTSPQSLGQAQGNQQPVSSYTGPSIVDFLASVGQPNDFASRARLAAQNGIQNYSGTASQNTQLLNTLRGAQVQEPPPPPRVANKAPEEALRDYGYSLTPTAAESFQIAPAKSFQEVYNGVIDAIGLQKVKSEMEGMLSKIDKMDQELADKVADVNENPWLSEGVRRMQVQKLQERYDLKRAPHSANLTILQDMYNNGRDEARYVATQTLNQYNQERNFQMDQIEMWMDQAEATQNAQFRVAQFQQGQYEFEASQSGREQDRALAERKFSEDVRQFGISESIQRYNAKTSRISATKPTRGSSGGGTENERRAAALGAFSETFSPGVRMSDGTPTVDPNGFITPVAWRAALSKAGSLGLKRADVISEFGGQLFRAGDTIPSSYGLSPVEQQLILGK